jgi:hypothetical protein
MVTCSISRLCCFKRVKTIKQRRFCKRVQMAESKALNLFDIIETLGQKAF